VNNSPRATLDDVEAGTELEMSGNGFQHYLSPIYSIPIPGSVIYHIHISYYHNHKMLASEVQSQGDSRFTVINYAKHQ